MLGCDAAAFIVSTHLESASLPGGLLASYIISTESMYLKRLTASRTVSGDSKQSVPWHVRYMGLHDTAFMCVYVCVAGGTKHQIVAPRDDLR